MTRMATLLFVHGTGVRDKAFKATLETITAKAAANVPGVAVKGCFWGDKYGAKLHHDGKSIPRYADTRGITDVDAIDEEVAAWACLLQDPLFELRLLVETQKEG